MKLFSRLCVMLVIAVSIFLTGCSTTKHVPEGMYLLDNVEIEFTDSTDLKGRDMINYLRQKPNYKVLGFAKLQLSTYSLSGKDSTKWYNKLIRKLGQPPVIYDPLSTIASASQLQRAMTNNGYMDATVTYETKARPDKKKIDVKYFITAGKPHKINKITYDINDSIINSIFYSDLKLTSMIKVGDTFAPSYLDYCRGTIAETLHNFGYYSFTKNDIKFIADTTAHSKSIDLTMVVKKASMNQNNTTTTEPKDETSYSRYYISHVFFITEYDENLNLESIKPDYSSNTSNGITIIYGKDHYLNRKTLEECCHLVPNKLYRREDVDKTYESLSRLSILKSVNIELIPSGSFEGNEYLNAYIMLSRNKKQSASVELEGTNSEGDWGFGVGLTYKHRNLAKGSEQLTVKLRTAYEALSGNVDDLLHDRYTEYAAEVGITFPKVKAPFVSDEFKRKLRASTEYAISFNYQERPEYTRIIAGAAWKYKWANRSNTIRRQFDLLDINYIYLPHSTINFIDEVAPNNPLLRYSYEDHFIMRMGFSYYRTNRRTTSRFDFGRIQNDIYTLRASVETAGNLLYGMSHLFGDSKDNGAYKIFGIQYSQFAKAEFDYAWTRRIDSRQSIALHCGIGVGFPYGNSSMIPFEERFYSGGANSVRGWNVRALGPGNYDARNSSANFINQCGDIKLDLNAEYRAKLIWKLELAAFIDAGNIWTIRNYENQPGGLFKFNRFYKEIAASYGFGARLDFDYFLIRLDLGMKAHNPAKGQEEWPIFNPNWGRDATFHIAVGYPF